MPEEILEIRDLACFKAPGQPIFSNATFTVREGDVLVLQGKSGSGKSTLLKCLAHLNLYEGQILFRGKQPKEYGIPNYRTRVLYNPQRPSLLPGTPRDFLNTVSTFAAHKPKKHESPDIAGLDKDEPISVARSWGIEEELWDRNWTNLSGGEAQRIALAIAVGMRSAEILLLDEPTSALDAQTSANVEKYLTDTVRSPDGRLKAVVWITHSEEQGRRVGTRFLRIANGTVKEERVDANV
ncbi:P-loop containing nucleoside triphosphate hydrolase protein [Panus rudis PR-1116 ss-1]|nr:P-loop containing nucleoside triphosphate hydrolase protein [Panus rudis PR-1116 ss-1]